MILINGTQATFNYAVAHLCSRHWTDVEATAAVASALLPINTEVRDELRAHGLEFSLAGYTYEEHDMDNDLTWAEEQILADIDYSELDLDAMCEQGWVIAETCGDEGRENEIVNGKPYGHRPWELQRVDELAIFANDDEAWEFVRRQVAAGDPLALSAKAFLYNHSRPEHDAIFGA